MPSIPHAFLSFKEFINFCKSRGLILSGGVVVYSFVQSLNSDFMVIVTKNHGVRTDFQSSWFSLTGEN
jgi:hypothetical protein